MDSKKIDAALSMLQKGEKLALALNQKGYMVGISGGKDSAVVADLIAKSGVAHELHHQVTGIDSPVTMHFIRDHYPQVVYDHPKKNYFHLVEQAGLPTMSRRFCCNKIKENIGAGWAVVVGVRAAESAKRAKMHAIEIYSRRREHQGKDHGRTLDELYANEHQCIKGQDRLMIRPIFSWSDSDVWEYIAKNNLPINPQYTQVGRVGCMFCPFASRSQIELYEQLHPGYYKRLMLAVSRYWLRFDTHELSSPQEYYEWWKSKQSLAKWKQRTNV